jgi:hypothetical protein
MKKITLLFLLTLFSVFGQAQNKDIETVLAKLPNLTYEKNSKSNELFTLKIRQPLDHSDTTKGFFHQKVYLSHASFEQPTVMVTAGYNVNRNYTTELSSLLESNQIIVEHRFFGESIPDSLDYNYLNLKQATADLHSIRQLLSTVYTNKWVSTGVSKGGVTTIFYKYFYPQDVDASVPYVAPINTSFEEQRIYNFLDTVGTEECRNKIKDFQLLVLKNREKIMPLLKFYSIGANVNYSYVSFGEAFEYAVMEYPFSFWQWGGDCNEIPTANSSIEEIAEYFISVSDPTFFGDNAIKSYNSHYYQSATEMGYYGYETSEFKKYLINIPVDSNPMALFYSFDMTDKFNGQLLNDLNLWLKTKGDNFIYIYGGSDTWSASAVPYNNNVNSEWFMLKGKHHGNARIKFMSSAEQERFISTLEEWLSIEITPLEK